MPERTRQQRWTERYDETRLPSHVRRFDHDTATEILTGRRTPFMGWRKGQDRTAQLLEQSHFIADKLLHPERRQPVNLYADPDDAGVSKIGLVTGEAEQLPASRFREDCFLPIVAATQRYPVFNALELHLNDLAARPGAQVRSLVLTAGQPVPAFGDYRRNRQRFSRKISALNRESIKEFDGRVRLQISSVEDTRKVREDNGRFSYHTHSNVAAFMPVFDLNIWNDFLAYAAEHMGTYIHDDGPVRDPKKFARYIIKPAALYSASGDEVVWYYNEQRRLRPVATFNDFSGVKRAIKESGNKISNIASGELSFVEKSHTLAHGFHDDLDGDAREVAAGLHEPAKPLRVQAPPTIREGGGGDARNVLLGFTLPSARFSPWREPHALVRNYDPHHARSYERLFIDIGAQKGEAVADWNRKGAPRPGIALRVAARLREADAEQINKMERAWRRDEEERAQAALEALEARLDAEADIVHSTGLTVMNSADLDVSEDNHFGEVRLKADEESPFWVRVDPQTGEITEVSDGETPEIHLVQPPAGVRYVFRDVNPIAVLPVSAVIPHRSTMMRMEMVERHKAVIAAPSCNVIPLPVRPRRSPCFTEIDYREFDRQAA